MVWIYTSANFQIELFEFRGEDITEDEDEGIIRRIQTKGQGYSKPNEGAAVEGIAWDMIILESHWNNAFYQSCQAFGFIIILI